MVDENGNKVVLIAGVTGGVGSAVAKRSLKSGHTVIGFARNEERLKKLQEELDGLETHKSEATDFDNLDGLVKSVVKEHGRIDSYVHAIGSVFLKAAHQMKITEWQDVINLNLNSAFYGLKAVVESMRKQRSGSMVFCSSVAAKAGLANHEAIAAAKGGINGLVLSASSTYAGFGLRFNAVAPGLVETNATSQMTSSEQMRSFSEKMHPLGRLGHPDEVASLISWLISDDASWVTGQIYSIDGGMGSVVPKPKM